MKTVSSRFQINSIENNTISGNTIIFRGGTYCDSSSPVIMNNTIYGNEAGSGGGIYSYSYSDDVHSDAGVVWKKAFKFVCDEGQIEN